MELEDLSIVEKAAMLSGGSEWDSRGNDRADIPGFVMSDGPHGVRRQLGEGDHLGIGASKPATCFPTACTVANTWDPALAEEMGEALGKEAHDLDVNVLLGPGMNIKRNPLCGRNFEYYRKIRSSPAVWPPASFAASRATASPHARSISRSTARSCAARPATPLWTNVPCANCI